jgi:phosphatidylglycerol---prolipoprotein diacylglyceryl transferase
MYPNLYFFLKETFGIEPWAVTRYIHSFGFFVAISFVLAAVSLAKELKRREKQGLLHPKEEMITVGKPASITELALNFIFGFIIGYKLLGIFLAGQNLSPQDYIFSTSGSWPGGIILGLVFSGLRFWEKNKQKLPKPEERKIRIWPHERVGDITIYAAIFGFIGAKVFDNLENWDRFIENPVGNLLSPSGLTFYGGLICAAAFILYYARRKSISLLHLVDSAAPCLMLAYALGRIGCQVSGDGDWGIFNSAYQVDSAGKIVPAIAEQFKSIVMSNADYAKYLVAEFGSLDNIPHTYFKGLSFLPNWFWAYNYPHNVNEVGTAIAGCTDSYCRQLNPPVFPTPLYETIVCLVLFALLWWLRKRIKIAGQLFAVYLVLNGVERFFVEKIRVNSTYNLFGFHPTQAELISSLLVISGLIMFFYLRKKKTA